MFIDQLDFTKKNIHYFLIFGIILHRGEIMNEFDDLFKQYDEPRKPETENFQNSFYVTMQQMRQSRVIVFIYVMSLIVTTILSMILIGVKLPNRDELMENITAGPYEVIRGEFNQEYQAFEHQLTFSLTNNNEVPIEYLVMEIAFYDSNGDFIFSGQLSKEDLQAGETWMISEMLYFNETGTDYEISFNVDIKPIYYILSNLFQVMLAGIPFLFIDYSGLKEATKKFKFAFKKNMLLVIYGFFALLATNFVSSFIYQLLGINETSMNQQTIISMFTPNPLNLFALFLLLCVFTPVVEEYVFRKALFTFVGKRFGDKLAIISSGLIFGIMHVISYGDFIQSIPYILMGMIFGYIYYKSDKNIIVTIILHFLNNFLSYLLMAYMVLTQI